MIDRFSYQEENGRWVHTYLSNGWIEVDGTTVEHEYQAYAKTTDPEWRKRILAAPQPFGPVGAKRLGRKAPLRPDHETVKFQVMAYYVTKKFRDHPELRALLIRTDQKLLVEGNTWHDNTWGDCRCKNADGRHPGCLTAGLNWLGLCLMTVRAGL